MYKEFKHKKQGDGSDSWTVTEWETDKKKVLINKYMVYEDPTKEFTLDISKVDISTLKPKQITELKILLGL